MRFDPETLYCVETKDDENGCKIDRFYSLQNALIQTLCLKPGDEKRPVFKCGRSYIQCPLSGDSSKSKATVEQCDGDLFFDESRQKCASKGAIESCSCSAP